MTWASVPGPGAEHLLAQPGLDWHLRQGELLVHHSQAGSSWLPRGLKYQNIKVRLSTNNDNIDIYIMQCLQADNKDLIKIRNTRRS